jgi:hypothetical protein
MPTNNRKISPKTYFQLNSFILKNLIPYLVARTSSSAFAKAAGIPLGFLPPAVAKKGCPPPPP